MGVRDAVYRPQYIGLLDILSTPMVARDAIYRPQYIAPLKYSSTHSLLSTGPTLSSFSTNQGCFMTKSLFYETFRVF